MEKTLEEKKELAAKVIAALKKEYPDADCTLDYNEAWKLLVSVRLAAQCTDARVNVVVRRKSANLIMGDVFGKPAIVTDTHCIRLTNRIGLVDGIKEPKKVEMALWKIIPPEEGNDFCHRLVEHGRAVCTARTKPYCDKCCLAEFCEKNGVE